MSSYQSLQIPEEVVYEKIGDEAVLLHLETGTYFGLNPVGSRMWELLTASGDPQVVLDHIQEEYDVEDEVLRRDLDQLINELMSKKLILASSDPVGKPAPI
ncbi:MAG: PqqD family protein [Methylococcaceae bacterium]|nr:PqqD family protein [Methylococcaceae bacterium]